MNSLFLVLMVMDVLNVKKIILVSNINKIIYFVDRVNLYY